MEILTYRIGTLQRKNFIYAALLYLFTLFALPLFAEYLETIKSDAANTSEAGSEADISADIHEWSTIDSYNFTILYRPTASLRSIERRLTKRAFYSSQRLRGAGATPEEKIAYRVDYLFKRTKEILDMRPRIPKIKIRIFSDRDELSDEYLTIFGTMERMKSFYVYKENAIYTSEDDISDSILAHEMAHAIVDHYFAVIPPTKAGEALASYVDMHLDDE